MSTWPARRARLLAWAGEGLDLAHEIAAEVLEELRAARAGDTAGRESLVSADELGRELGVSRASVRRLDPPGYVVGGVRRFRVSEVIAWLDRQGGSPVPETVPVPDGAPRRLSRRSA